MPMQPGELHERISAGFRDRGMTLAVAESLTGGELSANVACAPASSEWFRGGIVAYASEVKHELLDVPDGPVVSEAAATAMARGAADILDADVAIAVTGVAGPDEQDGQPPGTVWFALCDRGQTETTRFRLSGDPPDIIGATCREALRRLLAHCETRAA